MRPGSGVGSEGGEGDDDTDGSGDDMDEWDLDPSASLDMPARPRRLSRIPSGATPSHHQSRRQPHSQSTAPRRDSKLQHDDQAPPSRRSSVVGPPNGNIRIYRKPIPKFRRFKLDDDEDEEDEDKSKKAGALPAGPKPLMKVPRIYKRRRAVLHNRPGAAIPDQDDPAPDGDQGDVCSRASLLG
jgi:hypothetical protein